MSRRKKSNRALALFMVMVMLLFVPPQASGEVKQMTDMEDKLEDISEEEKDTLEKLFMLSREIEGLKKEDIRIAGEVEELSDKLALLEKERNAKQEDYNRQLDILGKVLAAYQRKGPASYLDILLEAQSLSEFLKSLNILKDISYNVNTLLASLSEGKALLEAEQEKLSEQKNTLEQRKLELAQNLNSRQLLSDELESYLASLKADREKYQKGLDNMSELWEECKVLFSATSARISKLIGEGSFTMEDLNLKLGFLAMSGHIQEDTFNRAFSGNGMPTEIQFDFKDGSTVLRAPQEHLILGGNFVISGKSTVVFEVAEGSFYGMSLEKASLDELFENGPLMLDFETLAAEGFALDFSLKSINTTEDTLHFSVSLKF